MDIEQIKIVIKTAIPGKERIEMKRDILYIADSTDVLSELNDYPFIIANRILNKNIIQNDVYLYGYSIVINFFFNKENFSQMILKYALPENTQSIDTTISDPNYIAGIKEQNRELKKINLSKNVRTMLELLFPMSYPALLNVSDSFTLYIRQNIDFDLNTTFTNVSKTILKKMSALLTQNVPSQNSPAMNYSYLKMDGTIYTITKVTWLNDLLNHPIYRDFINEYIKFNQYSVQQHELLEDIVNDKTKILFGKIKSDTKSNNSLNIYDGFFNKFIENLEIYIESNVSSTSRALKISTFIFNLTNIIISLLDIYNLHLNTADQLARDDYRKYFTDLYEYYKAKNPNSSTKPVRPVININISDTIPDDYISNLSVSANDLNKFYLTTDKGDSESLSGISKVFSTRLTKIINELKTINVNIAIKDKYICDSPIINLTDEDKAVKDELKNNFSTFISFVDKIKELIQPKRNSTNKKLQELIVNYSKGIKSENTTNEISFRDILEAIKNQYIFTSSVNKKDSSEINLLTNKNNQELMKTEVCELDKLNKEVPNYEIFIALNLVEGEMKNDNIDDIKCVYRGMYLGKETKNLFTKYNKYDINQHLFFLSQKEINAEKQNLKIENSIPAQRPAPATAPAPAPAPAPVLLQGGTRKKSMRKKIQRSSSSSNVSFLIRKGIRTRKYNKNKNKSK